MLFNQLEYDLQMDLAAHASREDFYTEMLRAYKARPTVERKMFPWPDASNVVVPLVAITVDGIVSRLMKAIMNQRNFAEVKIKRKEFEALETPIRDWIDHFITTSGARDRIRTILHDNSRSGDAFVKPLWVEEQKQYHTYDENGNVVQMNTPGYVGVRWHVVPGSDIILPQGFDEWDQLPRITQRLRYTYFELRRAVKERGWKNLEKVLATKKPREDVRYAAVQEAQHAGAPHEQFYELYETYGVYEIPNQESEEPDFQEVILTFSLDARCFVETLYNPFFGKQRLWVKVPYLTQPHELYGQSAAEQSLPQQEEASTAHNQVIDAATAANAGIIVTSPSTNIGRNEEIYPGKRIVTEKPREDVVVLHFSEPSARLGQVEQMALGYNNLRTGATPSTMGVDTDLTKYQTATTTTAFAAAGQVRFQTSIDDTRMALQELLYITIQLEQQFRPDGTPMPDGTQLRWPPGDPRDSMSLTLTLTNEVLNRDEEIRGYELLITLLNEYYARFMQAASYIMNPSFPPAMKVAAIQVMNSSHALMKRLVDRFDIEDTDTIIPQIMQVLQSMMPLLQGGQGAGGALVPGAGGTPPSVLGGAGAGVSAPPGAMPPGAGASGAVPGTGGSSLPM